MKKILFVCLGNICRSPLADGLLRKKCENLNLNVFIDSAGTSNYHIGEKPDNRMISTAKKFNTDLSFLKARQFTINDFNSFDLIFTMDKSNYSNVINLTNDEKDRTKVKLFLESVNFPLLTEVPDPYYGTEYDFEECYKIVDLATDLLIKKYLVK